jgi:hypothetical protein
MLVSRTRRLPLFEKRSSSRPGSLLDRRAGVDERAEPSHFRAIEPMAVRSQVCVDGGRLQSEPPARTDCTCLLMRREVDLPAWLRSRRIADDQVSPVLVGAVAREHGRADPSASAETARIRGKSFAAIPVNCGSTQPVPRPETLNPY